MADGTRACDGSDERPMDAPEDRWTPDRITGANPSTTKDVFVGKDSLVWRYRQTNIPGDSLSLSAPSFSFKRNAPFALQDSVSH